MPEVDLEQHLRRQAGLFIAGLVFLVSLLPCSRVIEIVPLAAPTPVPPQAVAALVAANTAPAGPAVPDRIVAEVIGLDAPVVEMGWQQRVEWGQVVSEWNIPSSGAAWHRNSARPGEGSNVVISGHNNSAGGRVFARLEELAVGDRITLWNKKGDAFVYQVSDKKLVRTFAASEETITYLETVMAPTPQEQLTLITCWPSWTNTHRLIIIAKPV